MPLLIFWLLLGWHFLDLILAVLVVLVLASDHSSHHIFRNRGHELLVVFDSPELCTERRHFVEKLHCLGQRLAELHILDDVDARV